MGFPADHPLFKELIMGKDLILVNSYALAKNTHSGQKTISPRNHLSNYGKNRRHLRRRVSEKKLNDKSKLGSKCNGQSPTKEASVPKVFTKFSILMNQILRKLKSEPLLKMP